MRALVAILVLAWTTSSHAGELAVASEDAAFRAALAEVLAPTGVELRVAETPAAPSVAEVTSASRAIADREHTEAMVWLVFAGEGATLIAYHRTVDRALVRSLPYRAPLSPDQAAEAARMTRTMLLALQADPEPKPVRVEPPAPATAIVEAAPVVHQPVIAVAVEGGVRVNGPGTGAVPTAGGSVIWRPDRFGVAIAARYAPGVEVSGRFVGTITDHSIAIAIRRPFAMGLLEIAPAAGVALHRITVDGSTDGMAVSARDFDPAVRAGATIDFRLHRAITVGLDVSVDTLLRRQSYDVGAETVLEVPILQGSLGLVVTARIL